MAYDYTEDLQSVKEDIAEYGALYTAQSVDGTSAGKVAAIKRPVKRVLAAGAVAIDTELLIAGDSKVKPEEGMYFTLGATVLRATQIVEVQPGTLRVCYRVTVTV